MNARTLTTLASRLAAFAAAATLALAPSALAQDGEAPDPQRGPLPKIGPEISPEIGPIETLGQDDAEARMIELFGKVERRLNEIDRLLSDASAGDTSKLASVGESGIDELLDLSRKQGQQAVEDIDEILELAEQMNQQCQSPGSSSQCDKPGASGGGGKPSPLDQTGQQSTQREQTPDAPPSSAKEGNQPQDGEQEQSKPSQGETPKSPLASEDQDPRNDPGQNPPTSDAELVNRTDLLDRWGDLPVHARDVFRTEGGGDMPARYRDWIDSYYRRLNERR